MQTVCCCLISLFENGSFSAGTVEFPIKYAIIQMLMTIYVCSIVLLTWLGQYQFVLDVHRVGCL